MRTCSLQSGSNGNAIYVEADGVRLLFDAGISGRQARLRLATHGRDVRDIDALILSHCHGDHTRNAGVFQRLFDLPILCTPATHDAIRPYVGKLRDVRHFAAGDTLTIADVRIHTLPTPHDADGSVAFIIEHNRRRLGLFTDLGHPFRALRDGIDAVDAAYLESNYDAAMLEAGSYPELLKERIRGAGGHLSNDEAAALLAGCRRKRLRWVALAHLSGENNRPDVALRTHRAVLGDDYPLAVAARYEVSELFQV